MNSTTHSDARTILSCVFVVSVFSVSHSGMTPTVTNHSKNSGRAGTKYRNYTDAELAVVLKRVAGARKHYSSLTKAVLGELKNLNLTGKVPCGTVEQWAREKVHYEAPDKTTRTGSLVGLMKAGSTNESLIDQIIKLLFARKVKNILARGQKCAEKTRALQPDEDRFAAKFIAFMDAVGHGLDLDMVQRVMTVLRDSGRKDTDGTPITLTTVRKHIDRHGLSLGKASNVDLARVNHANETVRNVFFDRLVG